MKIIFFANTDWYLFNFRLGLAKYFQDKGHEVVMMSPHGEYGPRFSEKGFRWIGLSMDRRSLNPISEIRLLNTIRKIFKDEAPDVVHSFTIKSVVYGSFAAMVAGIDHRISAVTGLGHVFISNSLKARLLRPLVKRLLRFTLRGANSYLILQNPDDQRLFSNLELISDEHVRLVKGSGVDTYRFLPLDRDRGTKFRILLASRLLWEKGIQTYVDAASMLQDRKNELQFLLAGETDAGNPSAIPKEKLAEWEQHGLINALGHVEDMDELLKTVDLVVLPSHREGLPRGLLEAAAMALPIVTTDAPGCREIVEDGVNGFLVPIDDSVALAEKITLLLDDPELCRQYGVAGRQKVMAEFDERIVFEKTNEVYKMLATDLHLLGK